MPSLKYAIRVLSLCGLLFPGQSALAQTVFQIGRIDLDLASNGSHSPVTVVLDGVTNASVPIEVSFSATSSGTAGSNRGAAVVFFSIVTHLPLIDQVPMKLSPAFTFRADLVSTTPGAGFNISRTQGLAVDSDDDDPNLNMIADVGALMADVGALSFTNSKGEQGPDLEFAGHFAPIEIATGNILIHKNTPAGTYDITVVGEAHAVWDHNPGVPGDATNGNGPGAIPVPSTGNTLQLIIVPEPATLFLFIPVGLAAFRRRKR